MGAEQSAGNHAVKPSGALAGRTVLITGGSRGIGYAIARKVLEQGGRAVITGRNGKKLAEAGKRLEKYGTVYTCQWDIADTGQVAGKLLEVTERAGTVHCLVNNAGVYKTLDYASCSEEDWECLFRTNLKGLYFATNAVVKYFIRQGISGNIVNISSETGETAATNPYALTKAALNLYTKGLAYELQGTHIRVNAVAPGSVATEMSGIKPGETDIPMDWPGISGRLFMPEEIADIVLFLLSDASACINGEILTCNAGNTLRVEYGRGRRQTRSVSCMSPDDLPPSKARGRYDRGRRRENAVTVREKRQKVIVKKQEETQNQKCHKF